MSIETNIKTDYAWLIHHSILLIITGALVLGSVYEVENLITKRDAAEAARYELILQQQTAQTQTIQKQLAQDEQQWQVVQSQLFAQNRALENTIEKQNTELKKQQQIDATLSAQTAAERLATQTSAAPGEVVANGDIITLDLPITRRVVAGFDDLVATQENLKNTQTELTNETNLYTNSQAQVAEQKTLVTAQQNQLAAAGKACDARVNVEKAKARKAGLKGFIFGALAVLIGIAGHTI